MSFYQEYLQPTTIEDALIQLTGSKGEAVIIAGGTDLLLDLRQGRHDPVSTLIDVSGISEMRQIAIQGDRVHLGAAVTHKTIVHSPVMKDQAHCVVEGCGLIGGPQVRNVATIGGNISHALPAGDGTISLLALDTEVQISSTSGSRWLPLLDIFSGPGKVNFDRSQEIVTSFRFNTRQDREGSAFHRIMRPQGVAIAILNMAAWIKLDQNDHIAGIRISCGPAGPKPFRARNTEDYLSGKSWQGSDFDQALSILEGEVSLRTSPHRATQQYRQQLLPVLLREVLDKAAKRAVS